MSPRITGWLLVAVQFVLLVALIALPGHDDWPTPVWAEVVGWSVVALGGAASLVAARDLGSALTPTPEPREGARLRTDGYYRLVRHPIYSGLLVVIVGLVIRSGSWITLGVGVATIAFFAAKSVWEERRLSERYPDYPAYAARVGRFVPRMRR